MGKVKLAEIVGVLEGLNEGTVAFLHRHTGEVRYFYEDPLAVGAGDPDDGPEQWEAEYARQREECDDSEDWVALPDTFDINELSLMEDFAATLEDQQAGKLLSKCLEERGAARRFKETLRERGLKAQWRRFRDVAIERIAVDWLEEHGIAYEQAPGKEKSQAG